MSRLCAGVRRDCGPRSTTPGWCLAEVERDDRIVAANDRLLPDSGYKRQELVGKTIHEFDRPRRPGPQ